MVKTQPHFLLVTYPAQGHINPALQFAKRLLRLGVKVTFATCLSAYRRMTKAGGRIPDSLSFAVFSDGFDDGFDYKTNDVSLYLSQLRTLGKQSLKETILSSEKDATPITCMVYTILLPWAEEVARELNVPSALLWIQAASVFRVYYYYFNGYDKLIGDDYKDPSWSIELPGLPPLKSRDLPSFCLPSNAYSFMPPLFREQIDMLDSEDHRPKILVNTFDALEEDVLKEIDERLEMVAVGPLIPSAFLDGKDPSDTCFGGDMFKKSAEDYLEWINSNSEGSIVYISFGSLITLSKKQREEMAKALLEIRRPFLWVIRDKEESEKEKEEEGEISCKEELENLGLIVPWCSQVEVLSHRSIGCFVTHCGWNSTLESLVCGVPVVAFPHWTDQSTNAKLLEDVWGTGVRVRDNDDGIVESEEIRRCVETVMGVSHEEEESMRNNANKWKDLAREAMNEKGSSFMNLKTFVEEVDGSFRRNRVPIENEKSEFEFDHSV